jgi:hypothetical protein
MRVRFAGIAAHKQMVLGDELSGKSGTGKVDPPFAKRQLNLNC